MNDPNKRHKHLLETLEEMKNGVFNAEDLFHSETFTDIEKKFLMTKFIEHKNQILENGDIERDLFITTDPIERNSIIRTWGTPRSNRVFSPIEDDYFAIIAGEPGAGKTAFTFFLAEENSKVGLVCYLSLEMSSDGILTRKGREYACITKEQWRDKSKITELQKEKYIKRKKELRNNKNLKLIGYDYSPQLEEIFKDIKARKPHLAFIDNLDLIAVDNSLKDPQKDVVEKIKSFTKKELVPIILIHHLRKNTSGKERKLTGDDMRGSGKIRDNIDALLLCKRVQFDEDMTDKEKAIFCVKEAKDRSFGDCGFHTYYFNKGNFEDEFIGIF